MKTIAKFGPPTDMDQTIRTVMYASPRMEVDELNYVHRKLSMLMGKEYTQRVEEDDEAIHKVVSLLIFIKT
jgi:hypothetical protein